MGLGHVGIDPLVDDHRVKFLSAVAYSCHLSL